MIASKNRIKCDCAAKTRPLRDLSVNDFDATKIRQFVDGIRRRRGQQERCGDIIALISLRNAAH